MTRYRAVTKKERQGKPLCSKLPGRLQQEHSPDSLESVVVDFIQNCRDGINIELMYYRDRSSLPEAIDAAALATTSDWRRHRHQARIPPKTLKQGRRRLLSRALELGRCKTFDELLRAVDRVRTRGLGVLWAYDTAHRIGMHLGLEPNKVYLHRGTTEGARALGLAHRKKTLRLEELPSPFRRLRPSEIEDCLCIYKDRLKQLVGRH